MFGSRRQVRRGRENSHGCCTMERAKTRNFRTKDTQSVQQPRGGIELEGQSVCRAKVPSTSSKRAKGNARPGASFHADQPGVDVPESRPMEGGGRAGCASDGDELEGAGDGASRHADQHGQPGVDVPESRPMEGGGRAGGASDGDEKEGAGDGASFHADQHEQPGVRVESSKSIGGGNRADDETYGDEHE